MIIAKLFPREDEFGGDVWTVMFPCTPKVGDFLRLYVRGHGEQRFRVEDIEFSNTGCEFEPDGATEPALELWLGIAKAEEPT